MKDNQELITVLKELEQASYDEFLSFCKKKKVYRYNSRKNPYSHLFWQSEPLFKWLPQLSRDSIFPGMLRRYFAQEKHAHIPFLEKLALEKVGLLIKEIKMSQAYLQESHWESFAFFKSTRLEGLKPLYKEMEFLRKLINDWKIKEKTYRNSISAYPFEDWLVHTLAYFEKIKRSDQKGINNQAWRTSIEITFCYVLNEILRVKCDIDKDSEIIRPYSGAQIQELIEQAMPPINPIEGIKAGTYLGIEKMYPDKKSIREVIDFYFSRHVFFRDISRYSYGYATFQEIEDDTAILDSTEAYKVQRRNELKNILQEFLSMSKVRAEMKDVPIFPMNEEGLKNRILKATRVMDHYWQYVNFPLELEFEFGRSVDLSKVFLILKTFSTYLMPSGRLIFSSLNSPELGEKEQVDVGARQPKPKRFTDLFGESYVYVFEEDDIAEKVCDYFGWSQEESNNIIDFLTLDLANPPMHINFLAYPLIKVNHRYFWLSSFLRNRRWDVGMHLRLAKGGLLDSVKIATKMEEGLRDAFRQAGFSAISSFPYHGSKGKNELGEIDVLVYKEKTLFVFELKMTHIIEDLKRYQHYQNETIENKAVQQLKRSKQYIQENYNQFVQINDLQLDCALDELQIELFIVTNIFELDELVLEEGIRKLSMFELLVILKNDIQYLYDLEYLGQKGEELGKISIELLQKFGNWANPDYGQNQMEDTGEELETLWTYKEECSATDLLSGIRERKVWKRMDQVRQFGGFFESELSTYSPDRAFLRQWEIFRNSC